MIIPFPSSRAYTMAMDAFDLAEQFQTPVRDDGPRPRDEQLDVDAFSIRRGRSTRGNLLTRRS
jgi:hypothetical protein